MINNIIKTFMKIIKSSVEILPQESGVVGMLKHIERIGRIAYKSEDKITDDSYIKFIDMLKNRGHWAVFDSGTVYMIVPRGVSWIKEIIENPYSRVRKDLNPSKDRYFITTNYRVVLKLGIPLEDIKKYWADPNKDSRFYKRVTSHWICSRGVSHELVRHRVFSFLQESQRYVNYSKDRFGGEITYIIPQWIYRVREDIGNTIDSQTGLSRNYILSLDGQELVEDLAAWDRTVAARYNTWKAIEDEYIYETTTDEGEHLKPEEARGILCNDVKTELCITGYLEDYIKYPNKNSTEKEGFFYLRTAKDAHPDLRVLAIDLENQFYDYGLLQGDCCG